MKELLSFLPSNNLSEAPAYPAPEPTAGALVGFGLRGRAASRPFMEAGRALLGHDAYLTASSGTIVIAAGILLHIVAMLLCTVGATLVGGFAALLAWALSSSPGDQELWIMVVILGVFAALLAWPIVPLWRRIRSR